MKKWVSIIFCLIAFYFIGATTSAPIKKPILLPFYSEIQINSIPFPLNIGGLYPYIVWVNGKKVNLKPGDSYKLAVALGLPLNPPATEEMHNGEGWLNGPLAINKLEKE